MWKQIKCDVDISDGNQQDILLCVSLDFLYTNQHLNA